MLYFEVSLTHHIPEQNRWSNERYLIFIKSFLPRIPTNLVGAALLGSKIIIYGGFTGDSSIANAISFDTRMYSHII